MAKAYWVGTYRAAHDADKLAAYAKRAGAALQGAGGKFLARGTPAKTYENGLKQRCVVIEFDSVAAAQAAHDSPRYKAALQALRDGADRDIRIMEGAGGESRPNTPPRVPAKARIPSLRSGCG